MTSSDRMKVVLKVRRIGKSLGIVLSEDISKALGVAAGDKLVAVRTTDGILLTPHDRDFATIIDSTRDYMRRHRNSLRKLAGN